MILTDTFIVENAELVTEERGGRRATMLRGIFGRCDEKNNNGRVYSKNILEREVVRLAEAMGERRLLGELDHPSHDSVKLSNVSHLITNLSFKNNELLGECELLDTPAGKVAQALVSGGVKVGISSRGMGTLSEQQDGTKKVNEDFKLVTFDLVADPSTRGAFPGISESTQSVLVDEIVKETLNTAAKEKVFTTILKQKLREKKKATAKKGLSAMFGTQDPGPMAKGKPELVKLDRKPTKEDPLLGAELEYGWNTGKPRKKTTRSYNNSDEPTTNPEVSENKYSQLQNRLDEVRGTQSKEMKEVSNVGKEAKRRQYMRGLMGELRNRPKKK